MCYRPLSIFCSILLSALPLAGGEPGVVVGKTGKVNAVPSWIWTNEKTTSNQVVYFRREVTLPAGVTGGGIDVTCDNSFRLWVNGQDIGRGDDWGTPQHFKLSAKQLKPGRNVIAVAGKNAGGSAAMALRFQAKLKDGKELALVSDKHWQTATKALAGWSKPEAKFQGVAPKVMGAMGMQPWGMVIGEGAVVGDGPADMTAKFQVAEGFQLDRIYTVPKAQGSWVSMTIDDQGRLICGDQYGAIYRVTLGEELGIEKLDIALAGAQGLLWKDGALYVSVNAGGSVAKAGVYRVDDTNGDGEPDKVVTLMPLRGGGEHGPHALVESPDGKWIYLSCGNHTDAPECDRYMVPKVWEEDHLLARRPDARGHARSRMAPGGWVARFRPDGSQWEMVGIGFRNQYDIAFNDRGDLFAYDADMEWDLGLPWYRPTRIAHVVPGLEFGWRNGTGKWPEYYEDSLPAVIDIGPGSPTGFLSGKGAAFPERYQRALYALDWTFGTISALHLKKDGASYTAEREEFVAGAGLPLTDGVIGKDGAMYFATGGRRTASHLWRVTYTGKADAKVAYQSKELELMDPAAARKALGASDRALRFQARAALEAAGAAAAGRPGDYKQPWAVINRVILGARINGEAERAELLKTLDGLDWAKLDADQKLAWLRAASLVFTRSGAPDAAENKRILAKIDASYPSNDATLNAELCRMLCYLKAPGVVGRTLALMDAAGPSPAPDWMALAERNRGYGGAVKRMLADMPSSQVVHYVNCLRTVPGPWDKNERERFFTWLARLEGEKGGNSFVGYIKDFRKQALAVATEGEREWLAKHAPTKVANPFEGLPPVKGPGHNWTVDEVVKLAGEGLEGRDKEAGERMFKAALCAACHRFGGDGGAAGPDLTAAAGRFTVKDLAEAIIEPGKVVSDQYAFEIIKKRDGTQVVGRTVDQKDEKLIVAVNPFDFSQTVEVVQSDIVSTEPSPISPMPAGMISRLNKNELKDLLAYLLSK